MITRTRVLASGLAVWLVLAVVSSAVAGEVMFSIRDGRVTLVARNAPISDILAVWEKEGRTKIVAREKVTGMVTSLDLINEPEASALAIVLRGVSGYLAVKNPSAPDDASMYRYIVINPAPAPVIAVQASPMGRPTGPPSMQSIGVVSPTVGEPGGYPAAFVPPPSDDNDDAAARSQMPAGLRQPGMPIGGLGRMTGDGAAQPDPSTRQPAPPSTSPGFPSAGVSVPGAVVPATKPPAAPGAPPAPTTPIIR